MQCFEIGVLAIHASSQNVCFCVYAIFEIAAQSLGIGGLFNPLGGGESAGGPFAFFLAGFVVFIFISVGVLEGIKSKNGGELPWVAAKAEAARATEVDVEAGKTNMSNPVAAKKPLAPGWF